MHQIVSLNFFLFFFILELKKTSTLRRKKGSLVILASKKFLQIFLQFLVLQGLSHLSSVTLSI